MTTNRKIIIAIAVVLALAVIAIGVVLGIGASHRNLYHESIATGNKYLAAGDYESAIRSFEKAAKLDPEQREAYEGLVRVYSTMGDTDMIQRVLQRANRHDVNLNVSLSDYENALNLTDDGKMTGNLQLNSGLLTTLTGYSYNDYRIRSGIASSDAADDGSVHVRVNGISATLIFRNDDSHRNAVDTHSNKVNDTARPAEITLDNVALLFGKDNVSYAELQSLKLSGLKQAGSLVTFMVHKYIVSVSCDANGMIGPDSVVRITLQSGSGSDEEEQAATTKLTGTVIDASTGGPVSSADLYFRSGASRNGSSVKTVKTDSYGNYSVDLPSGNYTVEVRHSGYTTEFFAVYVGTYQDTMSQNFSISPELQAGEIRIVLEWANYPEDLDSHLSGTGGGESVHVDYNNKYSTAAELDVDDTNGYGPETITIHDVGGSYKYDVVDYENTGDLRASAAVVKVYVPGREVMTISIADSADESTSIEKVWHVVTIDGGVVTVDNRIVNV